MKRTVKELRSRLASLIREIGREPRRFARDPERDFTRRRKLSVETLISALLCLGGGSLGQELMDCFGQAAPSVSAFVQQRDKLLPLAMETLFHRFTDELETPERWHGYRLLAVDGTSLKTAPYPADRESYLPGTPAQHGWNQFHLNVLFDLRNKLYLDAQVQKERRKNEGAALRAMVDRSPLSGPVLLLADRNYESYNNMAHLEEKGWKYLIRVKDGKKGIASGLLLPERPEFDLPIQLSLSRKQDKKLNQAHPNSYHFLPSTLSFDYLDRGCDGVYTLAFRLVRLTLPDGSPETLVTNLDAPIPVLRELYALRWGIETSFRQLKYTVGLLHFHARKPNAVLQEIFSRLIVFNFTQAAVCAAVSISDNTRPNFSAATHLCRAFIQGRIPLATILLLLPRCLSPLPPSGRRFRRPIRQSGRIGLLYRLT